MPGHHTAMSGQYILNRNTSQIVTSHMHIPKQRKDIYISNRDMEACSKIKEGHLRSFETTVKLNQILSLVQISKSHWWTWQGRQFANDLNVSFRTSGLEEMEDTVELQTLVIYCVPIAVTFWAQWVVVRRVWLILDHDQLLQIKYWTCLRADQDF